MVMKHVKWFEMKVDAEEEKKKKRELRVKLEIPKVYMRRQLVSAVSHGALVCPKRNR